MLKLYDAGPASSRREFLRVGGLSLGTLSLLDLLGARAQEAGAPGLVRDKAVVFLFLHGGPSQFETFDPKPAAPSNIRSQTGECQTSLPGITFGGTFPRLAARANKFTSVRSYVPGDANHDIKPVMSRETSGANLGTIYSRLAGMNHPRTALPTNAVLFPRAVDPGTQAGITTFGRFDATGTLGGAYAPFVPGSGGTLQQDMRLRLPLARLGDRRNLLKSLDQVKKGLDAEHPGADRDPIRELAFSTILGGVADAFDLNKEDPRLVARYDTAPLVRPENISKKWKNYNHYVDNAKTLGKLLLLARRLCERGCGFVTVTTSFVWDMHADENNAGVKEGMGYMGVPLDYALSAFIDDVEARGLTDKILLIVCGEMGRTPTVNKNGGRDHWGNLGPLLLYGGGLKPGCVLGQSNRQGGEPSSQPVTTKHVIATALHSLLDIGRVRVVRGLPREIAMMTEWEPIPGLQI